ncbi:Serine/threonine protein kinase PrkC, regulator of stationary phase [Sandaracinus amylolyticus]|uniref:Serine/threonine protein kinase PrkC, regulator of stationary phase n=2 Tax=Sandaracinus amylolyticus TaxID=927083 RepID=A0A0F6VZR2_9BACT|nr:Serine/threonine protein kinase PrkC, regulator of stationary phase [Sandaracinus amylolyticus]
MACALETLCSGTIAVEGSAMKICPACQLKYTDADSRCLVDNTVLETLADERIGTLLGGRYHIEKALGEGGMAVVYRARNALVDRPVAVKIMNPQLSRDAALKERFRREAKNAAAIAHPNIIEIHDYGETDDGTSYLVMELLDGAPLDRLIANGPMPAPQVCTLGLQIARGLARAHDFGVLHRDLKPENVFVSRGAGGKPVAKILDFGIARSMHDQRLTSAGQIFGTPQYMAPERVTSIDSGPSADLYALGVILFEMLTGRLPFQADDIPAFLILHLQATPPKPSELVPHVPRRLEELILRMLAKRPEDRPVDAHQVEKELAAMAPAEAAELPTEHQSVLPRPAAPTLPPTTLERWAARTALFDQMLERAYPRGDAPPDVRQTLSEIREVIRRMHELRSAGLKEQRKLESMEAMAREGRQRLGHAMNVLGTDLSSAREAARTAHQEVSPYFDAASGAERAYRDAHRKLAASFGLNEASAPSQALVMMHRELADALDRWLLAHGTAQRAREWVESKQREVKDLEFQTEAIRGQLDRLETSFEQDRKSLEQALEHAGREIDALDKRLMALATRFLTPLRARRELGDLMQRLEQEGTPASGLQRPGSIG